MDYEKLYKELKEVINERYIYNKEKHRDVRDGGYREGFLCGCHWEAYRFKMIIEEREKRLNEKV